jgi:hypothetical protein
MLWTWLDMLDVMSIEISLFSYPIFRKFISVQVPPPERKKIVGIASFLVEVTVNSVTYLPPLYVKQIAMDLRYLESCI